MFFKLVVQLIFIEVIKMLNLIGDAAGIVWQYLDTNGPASATKIIAETDLNKVDVQRGIGWLMKEGKLNLEMVGRTEIIALK